MRVKTTVNATTRRPLVLVPGFGGSKLVLNNRSALGPPGKACSNGSYGKHPKNAFINLGVFSKDWERRLELKFDRSTGISIDDGIDVYDFGGVDGVQHLCEECTVVDGLLRLVFGEEDAINEVYNYRYYDAIIEKAVKMGHVPGVDLMGAPYDFRKVLVPRYLSAYYRKLKQLIEDGRARTGRPCVLTAHSLGGLLAYAFLTRYVDAAWKVRHVHRFVSLCAPYGGCSIALKTLLCGAPGLGVFKERYSGVLQKSTGIIGTLPNPASYDPHQPIVKLHTGRTYTVYDYLSLLPESTRYVHNNYVHDVIEMFGENTGVDTTFIVCCDRPTEISYEFGDDFVTDEPVKTHYAPGDAVVHADSLLFHARNDRMYENFEYVNLKATEHSKVLHSRDMWDVLVQALA